MARRASSAPSPIAASSGALSGVRLLMFSAAVSLDGRAHSSGPASAQCCAVTPGMAAHSVGSAHSWPVWASRLAVALEMLVASIIGMPDAVSSRAKSCGRAAAGVSPVLVVAGGRERLFRLKQLPPSRKRAVTFPPGRSKVSGS